MPYPIAEPANVDRRSTQSRIARIVLICLLSFTAILACAQPAPHCTGSFTWTKLGSVYTYSITIRNDGATDIGWFGFAYTPYQGLLPSLPSATESPDQWTAVIAQDPPYGNYIIWNTMTAPIASKTTVSGFKFSTTDSPATLIAKSPYDQMVPTTTSNVCSGSYFQSSTPFQFSLDAPPLIQSLTLAPTGVVGGIHSFGTVTLSGPAGSSGQVVTLSSSNPDAKVSASVLVPKGATTAKFTITTIGIAAAESATITAKANQTSHSAKLAMSRAALAKVVVSPSSVFGGTSSKGTLTLNGKSPSVAESAALKSSNAAAVVPANVTLTAQSATTSFTITTKAVSQADVPATITATYNGVSKSAVLVVKSSIHASATVAYVKVGSVYTYTITLSNDGSQSFKTFFFAWDDSPVKNFLPVKPSSTASPAGWSVTQIEHLGSSDGYGIEWQTSGAGLASGSSLAGFKFSTTSTPSVVLGSSSLYPAFPVGSSFVYLGAVFGDPGFQFVVKQG